MINSESSDRQTFHSFFDSWLSELSTNLEQLVSAANRHHNDTNVEDNSVLRPLIEKVAGHYQKFYDTKSEGAKADVISMFTPTWLTTLEYAFLWIAGWRPTTAIHLLYSKSGIELESRLADVIPELNCGDLGDLTLNQMNRVDELQKKTIREERRIGEKMAKLQESAADTPMVDLSNVVSEMMRKEKEEEEDGGRENDRRVESTLGEKKDGLEEVLGLADGLRMQTLKSVVEILTPLQAVHFLIAAAELHLRVHDWGKKRDGT